MGHKEIGMINGPPDITPFSQLRNVFNSTLKEVGIDADKMYFNVNHPHGSFARQVEDCFEHLMQAPKLPSALLVQSGLFCKGFISRLAHAGIRVPEDISIVCFWTSDWEAEKYFPAITAIENRNDEVIAPAVSMLKDLVDGREVHRKNILVQAGFTKRDTVAPFGKNK